MKKLFLTILCSVMFTLFVNSQVLLQQDFSAGTMPPTGWTIMGSAANYTSSATSIAGGVAPELYIQNTPSFNSQKYYFISPQINTTGLTKIMISFKHAYKHKQGGGSFKLSVETRRVNSTPWHEVWSKVATADIGPENIIIMVDNNDVGSAIFQFCLKIDGSSSSFDYWAIDDINALNPLNLDATVGSVSVPSFFVGNQLISGTIYNVGNTAINSADISWSNDDGDITTQTISGLNVTTGNSANFSFPDSLIVEVGTHLLKVWVSNVNGLGDDNNINNDTLYRGYNVPEAILYRRPMFEEFTSSTCGPCASFNNGVLNPFIATYGNQLTLVKYQMNWPGSGDPYYTAEGGVRRNFYGVSAVPEFFVDGKKCGTNSSAVTSAFNTSKSKLTYVGINSLFEVVGDNVNIDLNINPYNDYINHTLQIVIVEKKTTQNVGNNGETSFTNVMMKMVPDANGTTVNLIANQPQNIKHTVNMSTTHVEEMTDLSVAIFIQNKQDKDIVNSGYSIETGAFISTYPQNGATEISVYDSIVFNFSQPVRNTNGSALNNSDLAQFISFKENNSNGQDVGFTATISSDKKQIIVTPDLKLKSQQQYYILLAELENNSGVNTVPTSTMFTTELNFDNVENNALNIFEIYPNPVSDRIIIKSKDLNKIEKIEVINSLGQIVKRINNKINSDVTSINVNDIQNGIYVVRVSQNGRVYNSKIVVKH